MYDPQFKKIEMTRRYIYVFRLEHCLLVNLMNSEIMIIHPRKNWCKGKLNFSLLSGLNSRKHLCCGMSLSLSIFSYFLITSPGSHGYQKSFILSLCCVSQGLSGGSGFLSSPCQRSSGDSPMRSSSEQHLTLYMCQLFGAKLGNLYVIRNREY